jgi:hypothetical protein
VYGAAQDGIWASYFSLPVNLVILADLGGSSCFKSPASPDPLVPEPEVSKPRAEDAKDEQQAQGNKKNGKRQNEN